MNLLLVFTLHVGLQMNYLKKYLTRVVIIPGGTII